MAINSLLIRDKSIKTFTLVEIVYYLYFALMLFVKGIGLTEGQRPYTAALIISAVLILIKLAITEHSIEERVIIFLLLALGVAIYFSSGEIGALILLATIVGLKDVPVDRVMILGCIVWIFSFILKILLVLVGVQDDFFRVQEKLGLGHIIRWSLGQTHPNVLQIAYMVLCAFLLYVFNWEGRRLVYATALMFIGNLYIFMYSVSYTGIVVSTFYLALNLYLNYRKKINKFERIAAVVIPIICMLFSIFGPMYFRGELFELCNKVFNNRFIIAKTFMYWNPVSLFGVGYCERIGQPLNNLDCSYVFALMHYGIIFFVLFFGGYLALIVHLIRADKRKELAIVLAMLVAAVSEPFFVNTSFKNISVVFLGAAMYEGLAKLHERAIAARGIKTEGVVRADSTVLQKAGYRPRVFDSDRIDRLCDGLKESYAAHIKPILIIAFSVCVVSAAAYALTKEMPAAYYMNRTNVQIIDDNYITLDINDLPDDFDGEILNYTDAETPMQRFDGNIVTVEYVRGIVSMGLWTGIFALIIAEAAFTLYDGRKNK